MGHIHVKIQGAAKGGRQKAFDLYFFFVFGILSVTFWSLSLMVLSLFFNTFLPYSFCWTPLQQDEKSGPKPCLSFVGLFENTKENLENTKDFSRHANPQKTL